MIDADENKLVIRKLIPASREEVFAAWTEAESVAQWMCPGQVITVPAQLDVRVGGSFRILMKSETEDVEHTGEYQVVDPPSKLVFTQALLLRGHFFSALGSAASIIRPKVFEDWGSSAALNARMFRSLTLAVLTHPQAVSIGPRQSPARTFSVLGCYSRLSFSP